jgi:hypothetical protein
MKMRKTITALFAILLVTQFALAQKEKPWPEWSLKEAEKILNDSAWSQTQVDSTETAASTSAITSTTAARREDQRLSDVTRVESGEKNTPGVVKYRVRLLSAKSVRKAFARLILSKQSNATEEFIKQLQQFVDRDFKDYIVVSVNVETTDKKLGGSLALAFSKTTTEVLKESSYLERNDGKRVALFEYRAPANDGLGAKYVFLRASEGKEFLSAEASALRFVSQLNEKVKLSVRFKPAEMMYEGKLEY